MAGYNKVTKVEKEKRVYQVSLMLRRKPVSYIKQYMAKNWELRPRQCDRYIQLARKEWEKYFSQVKKCGKSYYIAKLRDLTDKAYSMNDLRLILDIAKEEARLMGIYPSEKHEVDIKESGELADAKRKVISKINNLIAREEERKDLAGDRKAD